MMTDKIKLKESNDKTEPEVRTQNYLFCSVRELWIWTEGRAAVDEKRFSQGSNRKRKHALISEWLYQDDSESRFLRLSRAHCNWLPWRASEKGVSSKTRAELDYLYRRVLTQLNLKFVAGVASVYSPFKHKCEEIYCQVAQFKAVVGAKLSPSKLHDWGVSASSKGATTVSYKEAFLYRENANLKVAAAETRFDWGSTNREAAAEQWGVVLVLLLYA